MTTPLLCLHGFTGSESSFHEALELAGLHGWTPALLGHSPEPNDAQRFEDEVARLWKACPCSEPVHLVGYSMGGRVALGMLAAAPARVARATLIGVHFGLDSDAKRRDRTEADERWCELLEREGVERFVDAWEALPLFASQRRLGTKTLSRQRRERIAHDAHGLVRALRVLGLGRMPDYRTAVCDLDVPLHLVVGELDEKFRAIAEDATRWARRATVSIARDAGHNVVLEAPDVVARALMEGP